MTDVPTQPADGSGRYAIRVGDTCTAAGRLVRRFLAHPRERRDDRARRPDRSGRPARRAAQAHRHRAAARLGHPVAAEEPRTTRTTDPS